MRQDIRMPTTEARDFAAGAASPAPIDGAALSIRDLGHSYGELETIARLDLEVPAHGVLGLVGPSGCGKSTLLELIAGLQEPGRGEVEVGNAVDDAGRLCRCAFMPQRDLLLPWLSALDNAALALRNRGARRAQARREAGKLLRALRARRLRERARRPSSRAGCASGSPSCAR